MLGFEIFVQVQTFRRRPFVPSHNVCHPAKSKDQDHKTVLAAKDKLLTGQGMDWTEKGDFFLWGKCDFGLRAGWQAQWNNKTCTNTLQSVTSFVKVDCRWKDLAVMLRNIHALSVCLKFYNGRKHILKISPLSLVTKFSPITLQNNKLQACWKAAL